MGQQQLLLIILGVIIVGIAIAVGLSMFSAQSVGANKDAIINDINNLAANAYQFYIRPASMGGGGNSYSNYTIPTTLRSNDNASYTWSATASTVQFIATSTQNTTNTVTVTIGTDGKPSGAWTYAGQFQ